MKRDMDLVRQIMFQIEEKSNGISLIDIKVDGHTNEEIAYHVMILDEAGLVKAKNTTTHQGFDYTPTTLTWKGHEFIEAARNDKIWNKAKDTMIEKAGGIVFDVLTNLLTSLASKAVLGS